MTMHRLGFCEIGRTHRFTHEGTRPALPHTAPS